MSQQPSSFASQIVRKIRSKFNRVTASLWFSFCSVREKISGTASDAAIGGDRRTSFWSGSNMFSNVDRDGPDDVYAVMIAEVKFDWGESRYCSTRAVSS